MVLRLNRASTPLARFPKRNLHRRAVAMSPPTGMATLSSQTELSSAILLSVNAYQGPAVETERPLILCPEQFVCMCETAIWVPAGRVNVCPLHSSHRAAGHGACYLFVCVHTPAHLHHYIMVQVKMPSDMHHQSTYSNVSQRYLQNMQASVSQIFSELP